MPISIESFSFSTFLSVDFGVSSGSGFRFRFNDKEFVITAKHVIFQKDKLLSDLWIKSRNYDGIESDSFDARIEMNENNVTFFNNLDIALIELKKENEYHIETVGNNISIAEADDIIDFDSIEIGSNIFLIGFPSSLTTDHFYDVDRPLLRTGIVAGKNINDNTFVIDSLAYYGVSGGPVVQVDSDRNIKIIGIVSRFVPFITEWKNKHESSISRQDFYNSGYAVCIPLNKVVEFLNR
jgi:hypothetical protein